MKNRMPVEFHAEPDPFGDLCVRVSALVPTNPFYTATYAKAQQSLGYHPWILCLKEQGRMRSACIAFAKAGRLNRVLEVTSLPALAQPEVFWKGLLDFCRRSGITRLSVDSFGSSAASIPALPGEHARSDRCEYVLDLTASEPLRNLSSNHKRNIQRAAASGQRVKCTRDLVACEVHAQLIRASMHRRNTRGEAAPEDVRPDVFVTLVRHGAAELYQAVAGTNILSSVLVLRAARGAYYQSAGTSPEGMEAGASPFLIRETARLLRESGVEMFNLGGAAPSNPGLRRFKAGFGPREVALQSAEFHFGSSLAHKVGTAARLVRSLLLPGNAGASRQDG